MLLCECTHANYFVMLQTAPDTYDAFHPVKICHPVPQDGDK